MVYVRMNLESVADAEGDVAPVEVSLGDDIETGTDVEGELDGDSLEVVLKTSLSGESESEVAVVAIVRTIPEPHAEVSTNTGEPAEAGSDVALPLVDASERDGVVVVVLGAVAAPTEVSLDAAAADTPHGGKFCAVTLAAAETDTEVSKLCVCHGTHSEEHYDC